MLECIRIKLRIQKWHHHKIVDVPYEFPSSCFKILLSSCLLQLAYLNTKTLRKWKKWKPSIKDWWKKTIEIKRSRRWRFNLNRKKNNIRLNSKRYRIHLEKIKILHLKKVNLQKKKKQLNKTQIMRKIQKYILNTSKKVPSIDRWKKSVDACIKKSRWLKLEKQEKGKKTIFDLFLKILP